MGLLGPRDFKTVLALRLSGIKRDSLSVFRQCLCAYSHVFLLSLTLAQM